MNLRRFWNCFGRPLSLIGLTATTGFAATNTVTSVADGGNGSLRTAIAVSKDGDTVTFSVPTPATIVLTSGQLIISNNLTILGLGPKNLAVSANKVGRVFFIGPSNIVTISGLTISNGAVSGPYPAGGGGGINNSHSTLTLSNCTVAANVGTSGGGILNDGVAGAASLLIFDSTILSNLGVNGGGIFNNAGFAGSANLQVFRTTFNGNVATDNGGAIENGGTQVGTGLVQVVTCTISSNTATGGGGGIFNDGNQGSATLQVVASTFSGNTGLQFAGAILNNGIAAEGIAGGVAEIGDTILQSGNSFTNLFNNNGARMTSRGNNLSSDGGSGVLTAGGDQINTDPMLGLLQDNGGPTLTHALPTNSPAIDKGNFRAIQGLTGATDQRGLPRLADFAAIPNASGGDGSDIGAFEAQGPPVAIPLLLFGSIRPISHAFVVDFTNTPGSIFTIWNGTNFTPGLINWTALGPPTEISSAGFSSPARN